VSTAFCLQALALWEDRQQGAMRLLRPLLI